MNAENFREYLSDPSLLYQVPYEELKSLALEYPYNAHLRWLLLQKSRMEHRPDAARLLEKAAVYSIDRRALYRFMETRYEKTETPLFVFNEDFLELKDLAALREELPAPLEDAVMARPAATEPLPAFREPVVVPKPEAVEEDLAFDFTGIAVADPPEVPADEPLEAVAAVETAPEFTPDPEPDPGVLQESFVNRLTGDAVAISSFVEYRAALAAADAVLEKAIQAGVGMPQQPPPAQAPPLPKAAFRSWMRPAAAAPIPEQNLAKAPPPAVPEKKNKKAPDIVAEIARLSVTENAHLASETLADLLATQQQYDKAAKMYERLIMKFPEKSAYFAAKIEKLKKK